ncbi:MAG TPA: EAL domain-containing protein [Sulfuricurvum sp.]|nr:MAG: hypothetical protein B7Y30_02255 [Campylobacterales bacterium 16-40-21]OZA04212.1 MAG: hypothetical protein B7X89_01260 [Sulfuricurvum sp. 17-40-25]HQS66223.1 EAL domain-containing protein [Sulfuricurvum sp.]HQT35587.1 EAL domain-containing protein [Sulfuricurvum sp.]
MNSKSQSTLLSRYFTFILLFFTLLVLVSAIWNMQHIQNHIEELAKIEATTHLNRDKAFRLWATRHGGAYFIVDKNTQPSPFMAMVEDRDVTTSSGKTLTLYNPATMLRDIMHDYSNLYDIKTRITAKLYMNPQNAPDAWESNALEKLQNGETQVEEFTMMKGKKHLRLMQPMYMEQGCIKCHAWTGIKVGEVRGAIDVAIPLDKYDPIKKEHFQQLIITHLLLWLIGMGGILFLGRRLLSSVRENDKNQKDLDIRTQALEQSNNAVLITNPKGVIEYANQAFVQLNGYELIELLGKTPKVVKSHLNTPALYREMWSTISDGRTWKGEFKNRKKNGAIYWCYETISPVMDTDGKITHYIAVIEDIEKRKTTEEHIKQLVHYDALTNLPNRHYFKEKLDAHIIQACKENKVFGLIYIDLDRFKMVNDSLGHTVGDTLLQTLAERLLLIDGHKTFVSRFGGDEFAIITDFTDTQHPIEMFIERIHDAIKEPFFIAGDDIFMTASMGVSLYPQHGDDAESLIKASDIAMYGAKLQGKNTHLFFEPIHGDFANETLMIENGLRKAMINNELFLVYQPKWDSKANKFLGLEVLVRWKSPTLGFMNPMRFITIAEETDLIIVLGEWILKESLITMMEISKIIGFVPKTSVNLSPVQFRHNNLNSMVIELLEQTGFPPQQLELEITEGALVNDPAMAIEKMTDLCSHGVTFSIDDFGTGYSSMSYLKKFPVSTLKIDKSFVDDIIDDPHDRAIIQAIITLAESFGINTIAEGTETREQVDALNSLGCYAVQGYWHSRPIDYEALLLYFQNIQQ